MTIAIRILLVVLMGVFAMGCGGAAPPAKPETTTSAESTSKVETPKEATPSTTKTAAAPPPVPIDEKSAAGAILKTLRALEAGNLIEAYDFLPPSYQSDLDGLVHEFADRMDPEIWSRLIRTSRKSLEMLRTKKDLILALDLFRDRPEVESYRKHWDSTLQLLQSLAESDSTELGKLKQATARSLLPGQNSATLQHFDVIGAALGANLARQFQGVTVTPVRNDGADQVVALRGPHDTEATEIVYVQHEGRWLPKSLVDHWSRGIEADRAWLERLPARIKAIKPQLLDGLSQADEILDQLLAANNREQFEQAAGPAILTLATAWPNMQSLFRELSAGQVELPHVTVTINRELTERELTAFVTAILKPLRESGVDYTILANDGRTVCRLIRIGDVASLREQLATYFSIPADDVQFDQDAAAIKVELAP